MKFAPNILLNAFAACAVASAAGFAELRGEYAQGTIPPAISGNGHKKAQKAQKMPEASPSPGSTNGLQPVYWDEVDDGVIRTIKRCRERWQRINQTANRQRLELNRYYRVDILRSLDNHLRYLVMKCLPSAPGPAAVISRWPVDGSALQAREYVDEHECHYSFHWE